MPASRPDLRTAEALAQLRAEHRRGDPIEELRARRAISKPTLYTLMREAGIKIGIRKTGPARIITPAQEVELLRAYKRGHRHGTALAKTYGVHSSTIYRTMNLAGASRRTQTEIAELAVSSSTTRKLRSKYDGASHPPLTKVASDLGIGMKQARRALKRNSRTLRGDRGGNRGRRLAATIRKEIVEACRAQESMKAIANRFQTSTFTVLKIRRAAGIPDRRAHIPQHRVNSHVFDRITVESAYWIGLLMADGNLSATTNRIKLTLQTTDATHLDLLADFLQTDAVAVPETNSFQGKRIQAATIRFSDARLHRQLQRFGVTARKSLTAAAATSLLKNRHFWRGVVDGDGHLHLTKGPRRGIIHLGLTAGSLQLAQQFSNYAASIVGVDAVHLNPRKKSKAHHFPLYSVIVRGPAGSGAREFAKHLYLNGGPAIDRKRAIAAEFQTWKSRRESRTG